MDVPPIEWVTDEQLRAEKTAIETRIGMTADELRATAHNWCCAPLRYHLAWWQLDEIDFLLGQGEEARGDR